MLFLLAFNISNKLRRWFKTSALIFSFSGAQNSKDLRSRKASASPGVEPPEEMLNPGPLGFLSQNGPPCEAGELRWGLSS